LRIGILGSGNFSNKVLHVLNEDDKLEVVGAYDSLPVGNLNQFSSFAEFLVEVDTVLILDFLFTNYDMISEIVKNGKNVYIESPNLCSRRDLRNLELLAYESGSSIQIGLKQRFYNFYQDLEKYHIIPRIIDTNRFVKFNKNSTQLSVIDDLMLHDLDVSLKLANSEVKSVYATAVGVFYKDPDLVNARVEFYNGCVANLSASKIANKDKHDTKFFQNNTYCSIDFVNQRLKVQNNTGDNDDSEEQWGVKTTYNQSKDSDGYVSMLNKEINSFYNCIAKKVEPSAGISQYLQLQSVTDKIKEQLERNFTTNA
jgi:predicted dehydrogenase